MQLQVVFTHECIILYKMLCMEKIVSIKMYHLFKLALRICTVIEYRSHNLKSRIESFYNFLKNKSWLVIICWNSRLKSSLSKNKIIFLNIFTCIHIVTYTYNYNYKSEYVFTSRKLFFQINLNNIYTNHSYLWKCENINFDCETLYFLKKLKKQNQ